MDRLAAGDLVTEHKREFPPISKYAIRAQSGCSGAETNGGWVMAADSLAEALNKHGYCIKLGTPGPAERVRHDGLGLLFVHEGACTFSVRGWTGTVSAGTGIIFDNRPEHRTTRLTRRYVRTVLHFSPAVVPPSAYQQVLQGLREHPAAPGIFPFRLATPDADLRFRWAVMQLDVLLRRPSTRAATIHLFGLLLAEVQPADLSERLPEVLERSLAYMRAHLDAPVSISAVARAVYCSESYLRRLFEHRLGCSPRDWWLRLKMDEACRRLESGARVGDVARAVGFDSLRGFEKAFRRIVGQAPAAYRRSR